MVVRRRKIKAETVIEPEDDSPVEDIEWDVAPGLYVRVEDKRKNSSRSKPSAKNPFSGIMPRKEKVQEMIFPSESKIGIQRKIKFVRDVLNFYVDPRFSEEDIEELAVNLNMAQFAETLSAKEQPKLVTLWGLDRNEEYGEEFLKKPYGEAFRKEKGAEVYRIASSVKEHIMELFYKEVICGESDR